MNLKRPKSEDHFIIHACSLHEEEAHEALKYVSEQFDWDYYWEESVRNGVPGILYKHFKQYPEIAQAVPAHIHQKHEQYYYKTLARNTRIFAELEKVLQFLKEKGFEKVILLKGAYLLPEVYEDLGARPMSDIDILVEDMGKAEKIFNLLVTHKGFRPNIYRSQWEVDYRKRTKGKTQELIGRDLVIELHTPKYFEVLGRQQLFSRQVLKYSTKQGYYTLEHILHADLLWEHLGQHIGRKAFDLRSIVDIYYFEITNLQKGRTKFLEYLSGIDEEIRGNKHVHPVVFMKKFWQLLKDGDLLRYSLSFLFPSPKYLKMKFSSNKRAYPALHIRYLLNFIRRIKI